MKKLLLLVALLATACGQTTPVPAIVEVVPETPVVVRVTATTMPTAVPTAVPAREPQLSDFSIELIVVENQCFGSAGCLITVAIDLGYASSYEIPVGASYKLIYEISGGEDGVETFNLTADSEGYHYDDQLISTAHVGDELTVELVRILKTSG